MKPKLLIIHNRLVVGGPALDTIPLAYHLRNDFDIHILYGQRETDETEPTFLLNKYTGLSLTRIHTLYRKPHPVNDLRALRAIYRFMLQLKPDVVHTHGAKAGLLGRMAARKAKVPLVVHTFHGHLFHSYFNRFFSAVLVFIEQQMLKLTHKVITLSATQQHDLQQALQIKDASKLEMVPLGVDYIDHSLREHYRQAFKRTYPASADVINVGMLGRMVPIKNPVFFMKIIREVLQTRDKKNIRFFIIGDGSEVPLMKAYLQKSAIAYTEKHDDTSVIFTSWVQNIQSVLEGLDVVVLTSLNEGTPLSLIEAQVCGKPVVAVDVGGVRDTLRDTETGFLIRSHSIPDFANAIIQLAEDEGLRTTMGNKAASFARSLFSKEREVDQMKRIYFSYKSS